MSRVLRLQRHAPFHKVLVTLSHALYHLINHLFLRHLGVIMYKTYKGYIYKYISLTETLIYGLKNVLSLCMLSLYSILYCCYLSMVISLLFLLLTYCMNALVDVYSTVYILSLFVVSMCIRIFVFFVMLGTLLRGDLVLRCIVQITRGR